MVGYAGGGGEAALSVSTFRENLRCFLICMLVAVSNFQYGFDTGIINGFQAMQGFLKVFGVPGPNGTFTIGTQFQQLITSLLQVGLVVASALVGPFSTYFGRRTGFFVASVISCFGILIQILVTTQWPVYIGRILLGIGNGFYVNLTVLYIAEASPAHLRGTFVAVFQPFVNLGSFIGAVINNGLQKNTTKMSYRGQLIILYMVPLYLMSIIYFLPESPRWLMVKGKTEEAAVSLRRFRPKSYPEDQIQFELKTIQDAIDAERQIAHQANWKDMWKGPDLRRTLLSIACATLHAASGVNFLVGYGTFFFQIAGTGKPFTNNIILQCVNLATSCFSLPLARRFGRRTLILCGFAMTTTTMFIIAILYTVRPHDHDVGKALVGLLCIFLGTYGATIGPLSWVTAGEMSSTHLRSYTFGVGMAIGFFFAWLTTFTMPYFINASDLNWGAKIAWLWGPSNLITLIFVFFFLPETKGRRLEELDEMFYKRLPAWRFSSYVCEGQYRVGDSNDDVPSIEAKEAKVDERYEYKA